MSAHPLLAFARLLSSAVASQALLSAASFVVGLILIRNTTDAEYGSYILALSAILLLVSLQNAFFGPPLAIRLGRFERKERSELVGGLYREQRRGLFVLTGIAAVTVLGLGYSESLRGDTATLAFATVAAAAAILRREYFRTVLLAYRRPHDVLRTDTLYVALLIAGVFVAVRSPTPATIAVFTLGGAAVASGMLLSRALRDYEPWNTHGARDILRDVAPLGIWSTAGAATHWAFSQGYVYLVAGTLDIAAVAALAATRLLMMPVNLVSTGIGSLMLPLAAGWLQRQGRAVMLRRLGMFAVGMAAMTVCYFAVVWFSRDWIFAVILKKQFAHRDELLLLWAMICLVIVMREQLGYALAAQARFRTMTSLTSLSAVCALVACYLGMLSYGAVGALAGILIGELVNAIGIAAQFLRRTEPIAAAAA